MDEHSRNDCGRRVQPDVACRSSRSTHPSTASCGVALCRTASTTESATASRSARSTPTVITPAMVRAAIATSTRLTRARPRHAPGSIIPMAGVTMTALRAACGRY
jgi:hypothetical protein